MRGDRIKWVTGRTEVYDDYMAEVNSRFAEMTNLLNENTKMAEKSFIEGSCDRVINFTTKAACLSHHHRLI